MSGLGVAFKEWAVICRALAEGRQAVILRKGGVAEEGGAFRVEHTRFWLYPTYAHQQHASVVPAYRPLLEAALAQRPPEGVVRLSDFAEVARVYHVGTLEKALALADLHGWTDEAVAARFRYRAPGLYVLAVRVYRAASAALLPESPYFAGCKSWVDLGRELPDYPAEPACDGGELGALVDRIDERLAR